MVAAERIKYNLQNMLRLDLPLSHIDDEPVAESFCLLYCMAFYVGHWGNAQQVCVCVCVWGGGIAKALTPATPLHFNRY